MNGVEHTYGAFDGDRNVLGNAQSNKSPSAADLSHGLHQKTSLSMDIVASLRSSPILKRIEWMVVDAT